MPNKSLERRRVTYFHRGKLSLYMLRPASLNSDVGRFLLKITRLEKSTTKEYSVFEMNTIKAYEEVIDFIAAGTTPQNVIAFHPSQASQERVGDLLAREKDGELSPAEKLELDHYLQLEHLMRLAKARARDFLPNE